jgi:hypothetical protein
MNELLKKATGDEVNLDDDDMDEAFDSIRDFYLIGGAFAANLHQQSPGNIQSYNRGPVAMIE